MLLVLMVLAMMVGLEIVRVAKDFITQQQHNIFIQMMMIIGILLEVQVLMVYVLEMNIMAQLEVMFTQTTLIKLVS